MNEDNKDLEKVLLEDERISHFLQGLMNASEEAAFLEELKGNIELRQRASAQARLIKGMKQADEQLLDAFNKADKSSLRTLKNKIEKKRQGKNVAIAPSDFYFVLDEKENDSTELISKSSNLSFYKFIAAASIILIFFVGYKSYDYYDTTSLGKEYANTFPITSIIRGEANKNVETELIALFEKVTNDEDLEQTISSLATLWEIAKQDTYNEYTDYAPYIGWYLAIAYLEDYEKDRAVDILEEMELMYPEGTVLGDMVKELIKELQ